MFEKNGKFYADWRDASGRRIRKSFTSQRAALQFEAEQRELAHPKPKARGQQSPRSYAPLFRAKSNPLPPSRSAPSSPKLVPFRRRGSAPPTSPKSIS